MNMPPGCAGTNVDWLEVLVDALCGLVPVAAVPHLLALVLGRLADTGMDSKHEGVLL